MNKPNRVASLKHCHQKKLKERRKAGKANIMGAQRT